MKNETDQVKAKEYLEVLDQKSQRLKVLTDDLFEAAKASSETIPVNFEKIDIVSLITQGLGELDDKLQESKLEFKLSHPTDKVFIKADGKLLWRAVENLLSNIFKYALAGSRVYIDIIDLGTGVTLIIKNISAYELNISSDELMGRGLTFHFQGHSKGMNPSRGEMSLMLCQNGLRGKGGYLCL
ncbi:hypothetical protein JCM17380_15090 [Desulfosporosinus burensis]